MHVSGRMTRRPRPRYSQLRLARQGFLKFTVLAFLLPALLAVSPQRHAAAESAGYINTDVLNLREEPGTWATILDKMWQGEYVTVLDGPTGDGWYLVDYWGQVGWAYGGYLLVDGSPGWSDWEGDAGVGGAASTAWVNTDHLNVRSDASTDAWVMDRVVQGDQLTVVGSAVNGFVPIEFHGQRAYVWNDFLTYDGPVDAGPERWIDVDRSQQEITLYVGDEAIASYWGAMGWDDSADGFYATAIGTYYVYGKHADLAWTEWGQAYIQSWVGFDPSRVNGFHSFSMDANGNVLKNGDGPTGGCIALEPSAAAALFDFASSGMRVEVHW
jgi:uncharacterized protein YgiM (DUF1202 family)